MQDFWFYTKLGFHHVLDFSAYDHILFLVALAIPFALKDWKKVLLLATLFTIAHCTSLAFSVYELIEVRTALVEFLIPITILLTAVFNLFLLNDTAAKKLLKLHLLAASLFGLIHGLGFSNYFKMLMAGATDKAIPLLGFATGIELSQVVIITLVLLLSYVFLGFMGLKKKHFVAGVSTIIILATIPMLIKTFPW